jgi:ABC-2 type transport system ATP-binding protein
MIKVDKIVKRYDKVIALDELSLSVNKGELFGLIGPNGAGKSTLLQCIIGLLKQDAGEILVDINQNADSNKKHIGYAPEEPVLYPYLTGREFLQFIAEIRNLPVSYTEWVDDFFQEFGLQAKADELISDYSHGMKQKISLAASMIFGPQILLLDEPTNALDPESIFHFKDRLLAAKDKGVTIIFSSHILDTVEKICDRIGIIQNGKLVACDTISGFFNSYKSKSLEDIFMHIVNENRI